MSELKKIEQSGIYKKELDELKKEAEERFSKNENGLATQEDIVAYSNARTEFLQEKIDSGDFQNKINELFDTTYAIYSDKNEKSINIIKNGTVNDLMANVADTSGDDVFFNNMKTASDFNHVKAILELAYCYKHGIGTKISPVDEIYCYKRASDLGNFDAMYEISLCFKNGIEVAQNTEIAIYWLHKSAQGNNKKVLGELCRIYEEGDGVPQNHEIAMYWALNRARYFSLLFNDDLPPTIVKELNAILDSGNMPENPETPEFPQKYLSDTAPQNGDKKLSDVIFHLTLEGIEQERQQKLKKREKSIANAKLKRELQSFTKNIFKSNINTL